MVVHNPATIVKRCWLGSITYTCIL